MPNAKPAKCRCIQLHRFNSYDQYHASPIPSNYPLRAVTRQVGTKELQTEDETDTVHRTVDQCRRRLAASVSDDCVGGVAAHKYRFVSHD